MKFKPMKQRPKIVFFGTPEFAAPSLKALCQKEFDVLLAITQADKPVGRNQEITPAEVKVEAQNLGLKVIDDLALAKLKIKELKPEAAVVVAYGKILPQEFLDLFPKGILNVHPSLLPKYRGPSPIQAAILNGDESTGVSIIKLDEQMDHGAVISNLKFSISNNDTYRSLSEKLAQAGAELLVKILPDYLAGKIKPISQNDSQATFTKILKREDGEIDWHKSAAAIERAVRAYFPWPGCYGDVRSKNKELRIKLIEVEIVSDCLVDGLSSNCSADALASANAEANPPAQQVGILYKQNGRLYVRCGQDWLNIIRLQLSGKKEMTAQEFINGYLK